MNKQELQSYIMENWDFVDEEDKPLLREFGVHKE